MIKGIMALVGSASGIPPEITASFGLGMDAAIESAGGAEAEVYDPEKHGCFPGIVPRPPAPAPPSWVAEELASADVWFYASGEGGQELTCKNYRAHFPLESSKLDKCPTCGVLPTST